jgi:hypothetical protein
MTSPPLFLISFADLRRLFLRWKRQIIRWAVISAIAGVELTLISEPRCVAEGTFKQASGQAEDASDLSRVFRSFVSGDGSSSAVSIMLSRTLLKETIETLGWQIDIRRANRFWGMLGRVRDNLAAAWGLHTADPDLFSFANVSYGGEGMRSVGLRFIQETKFEILGERGERLAVGIPGEPVSFDGIRFTLLPPTFKPPTGRVYPLTLRPWSDVVSGVKSRLTIKPLPLDKSVLLITYTHRFRNRSAELVNQLMASYRSYLKREAEIATDNQLSHLRKRQQEVTTSMGEVLDTQVAYLKETLGDRGFIGLKQEIEILSQPQAQYTERLFNLDFELDQLPTAGDSTTTGPFHATLARLEAEASSWLEQEKVSIDHETDDLAILLQCVEHDQPLPTPRDPTHPIGALVAHLRRAREEGSEEAITEARRSLTTHLRDLIHSLHLKKTSLSSSVSLIPKEADFQGLGVDAAKRLHLEYTKNLDNLQMSLHQYLFLRDRIQDPDIELSSMGSFFEDLPAISLVQKALELEVKLRDGLYHSDKERERIQAVLAIQKRFISSHLAQAVQMHKIKIELVREKISSLQTLLGVLLKKEKALVEQKLRETIGQMSSLPDKWRFENELLFKMEMTKSLVEGLSKITESKTLARHMIDVESKPLDPALIPLGAKSPQLLLMGLLAAFLGAFMTYTLLFLRTLVRGLPVSLENLETLGLPTSGYLTLQSDGPLEELNTSDLSTLRRLVMWTAQKRRPTILLLGEKGPDFSTAFAELLHRSGRRALLIDGRFPPIVAPKDLPGLIQYLQGEVGELPIRSLPSHGFVPSGGTSRYRLEFLTQPSLATALAAAKETYDCVVWMSNAPIGSPEAEFLVNATDLAIFTLNLESFSTIAPYCDDHSTITFTALDVPL